MLHVCTCVIKQLFIVFIFINPNNWLQYIVSVVRLKLIFLIDLTQRLIKTATS